MVTIQINVQIDGYWATSHGLNVSGALPMLSASHRGIFDLSASRRAGGYTSAL